MKHTFLDDHLFVLVCLVLSVFRIYLEAIRFNFSALPITKGLPQKSVLAFHKMGLYFSIGYLFLFAPELLLS